MKATIIGAGRLVLPNPCVARARGWEHGLPLEAKVRIDLSALGPPGTIAEVGRLCVLERWRAKTSALPELCVAMCQESRRHGVTHWISAANLECDSVDEARLLHEVIQRRGLMRSDIPVSLRATDTPRSPPRFRFYTDEERGRAIAGELSGLRLPRAVSTDAKLGARYVGEPIWDEHFGMFAQPLVAAVQDVMTAAERYLRALERAQGRM
ncbi:GNAT family N-acetyltransferase [Sorangium sp. So ce861]|uniref:GNAT family N-acetyltransferase n=1 Tax=Sorangium sp. So ce861 TaxID=3133323 RepID=UPI003F64444C